MGCKGFIEVQSREFVFEKNKNTHDFFQSVCAPLGFGFNPNETQTKQSKTNQETKQNETKHNKAKSNQCKTEQ